jgi:N-methylhydantoinase B
MAPPKERSSDAIELILLNNALASIMDEMALTMVRTAQSTIMREAMDFSTAFADAEGQIVVQGLTHPMHLGGLEEAIRAVVTARGSRIRPGDVYVLNDPFGGGEHLPDIFTVSPVFVESELGGFLGTVAHHCDVGGRVPGSNAADSTEIYQEGLRIPVTLLYAAGEPNETLFALIEANVRLPQALFADLRAQLAASHRASVRILELAAKTGWVALRRQFRSLLDYSEQLTRAELSALPAGEYRFTDFIDDDGLDDTPIPIRVTVRIGGGEVTADFTGSSPQVRGAINATYSKSKSAVYLVVACWARCWRTPPWRSISDSRTTSLACAVSIGPASAPSALPSRARMNARSGSEARRTECCHRAVRTPWLRAGTSIAMAPAAATWPRSAWPSGTMRC